MRTFVAIGIAAGAAWLPGAPVAADPAGPTDYRSEIVSIEPATPTIEPSIVGGDSFVELRVDRGTEAMVAGYDGEDYLWFRTDGVVLENRNSPATHLNESRLGDLTLPDFADADAEPAWEEVATGGYWAWHDHRAHWMLAARPVGASPGDEILEAVIPVVVDGTAVRITVISTWLPAPSPWATWFGAAVGIALAGACWTVRRSARCRELPAVSITLPPAALALLVGAWQYRSLPAATDPRLVWFVLPAIGVVSAIVGVVLGRRGRTFAADALQLLVGVELAVWGFIRRDGLSAAIVPTDAPYWLDRFATSLALVGGVAFAGVALWALFAVSGSREPTGSPHPAHP